ncbi:hypothetical protein PCL_01885 [Purpureocillium lilacinum]|uniref:Uncharacterized protein n=1 Tax=Purpureocillium lilacinum TaxID=33203 RepID=A0A2U3E2U1_PURLI|nr:hypothetical protein PCL_01885 [Purpureocillium lilacinum]
MIAQRGDAGGDTEQQTGGFRVLGFRSPHERLPAEHAAQLARRDRVFAPDSLAKKGFDRKPCLFATFVRLPSAEPSLHSASQPSRLQPFRMLTRDSCSTQILYWFALLGYSVTVRVLAAPGDLDSRALGYIDRAQDVEVYCIVTCTLLFFAWLGPVAVVLFPMSVAAVVLCCVEAVRLSKISYRRNEYIMLAVLAIMIGLPAAVNAREGWVWCAWHWRKR